MGARVGSLVGAQQWGHWSPSACRGFTQPSCPCTQLEELGLGMKAVSWGDLGKQCCWSMQALQEVAAEI